MTRWQQPQQYYDDGRHVQPPPMYNGQAYNGSFANGCTAEPSPSNNDSTATAFGMLNHMGSPLPSPSFAPPGPPPTQHAPMPHANVNGPTTAGGYGQEWSNDYRGGGSQLLMNGPFSPPAPQGTFVPTRSTPSGSRPESTLSSYNSAQTAPAQATGVQQVRLAAPDSTLANSCPELASKLAQRPQHSGMLNEL